MTTAVDSNILIDILIDDPQHAEPSQNALAQCGAEGVLVVCDQVYAEVSANFRSHQTCDEFLEGAGIQLESLNREALYRAGQAWRQYRKQGGPRTRVVADFLIGAHAEIQASRLLTRDRGFYRSLFPRLKLLVP